jgi:hypothetical protein
MPEEKRCEKEPDIGPDHEDIPVGEVYEEKDPVNHRIPKGDQGVKAPPLEGV